MRWWGVIVERVIELLLAALLAITSILLGRYFTKESYASYVASLGDHLELFAVVFIGLLAGYVIITGILVRYALFLSRGERRFCGIYCQVFFGKNSDLVLAPFIILFDVLKNELSVEGHAFSFRKDGAFIGRMAEWQSTAVHISDKEIPDLTYLYVGRHTVDTRDITGVTTLGIPEYKIENPSFTRGHICDLIIPPGPLGRFSGLAGEVSGYRIACLRFDGECFRRFMETRHSRLATMIAKLRISRRIGVDRFEKFIKKVGLDYLAQAAFDGELIYQEVPKIIRLAHQIESKRAGSAKTLANEAGANLPL